MKDLKKYTLFNSIIAKEKWGEGRSGEGSSLQLKDGTIFLTYSKFSGGSADHDYSDIMTMSLNPATLEWSDPSLLLKCPAKSINLMSTSLLRLQNGIIALIYIEKYSPGYDDIFIIFSEDEGKTWSDKTKITPDGHGNYYVVNNDRLVQTKNSRIFVPVCVYKKDTESIKSGACSAFYSDDNGKTWKKSETDLKIKKENIILPHKLEDEHREIWRQVCETGVRCEEPGIVELSDGTLMMWCRTRLGYMYESFSENNGRTWSELLPQKDIVSPCGPQSIKTIPGTSRLLCIYNDHKDFSFGEIPRWCWRTPQTAALSDDDGKTWNILGNLDGTENNYCYTSIDFYNDNVLFTYYISENHEDTRRNLVSMKAEIIKKEAFTG